MADSEETRRALRRRVRAEERLLLVVAGPNGAGKSTFVETFLTPTGILVVDNSSADEPYRFVAEFREGKRRRRQGYHPAWAAFLD